MFKATDRGFEMSFANGLQVVVRLGPNAIDGGGYLSASVCVLADGSRVVTKQFTDKPVGWEGDLDRVGPEVVTALLAKVSTCTVEAVQALIADHKYATRRAIELEQYPYVDEDDYS